MGQDGEGVKQSENKKGSYAYKLAWRAAWWRAASPNSSCAFTADAHFGLRPHATMRTLVEMDCELSILRNKQLCEIRRDADKPAKCRL